MLTMNIYILYIKTATLNKKIDKRTLYRTLKTIQLRVAEDYCNIIPIMDHGLIPCDVFSIHDKPLISPASSLANTLCTPLRLYTIVATTNKGAVICALPIHIQHNYDCISTLHYYYYSELQICLNEIIIFN